MTLLKSFISIFIFIIISCCSSSKSNSQTDKTDTNSNVNMKNQKMIDAGFLKGTIVVSQIKGDCPYTIQMDNDKANLLDPINLEESFMQDGVKIWFKFNGLRMMNRCEKANPISIEAIQKREQ